MDSSGYDTMEAETTITEQAQYIAQLEDALNAFDGFLLATLITVPAAAKSAINLRDKHDAALSKAIPNALARMGIKHED